MDINYHGLIGSLSRNCVKPEENIYNTNTRPDLPMEVGFSVDKRFIDIDNTDYLF